MKSVGVSAGGEHTLIQRGGDGRLFSAGACGLGWCRRHPLNDALFALRQVQFANAATEETCRLFHASYYHNLAVGANTGKLYTWGCGTFTDGGMDGVIPALGQGHSAEDVGEGPKAIDFPTKAQIEQISGGAYHSIVMTKGGSIFTFGAGQLGQLGRPTAGKDASGLPVDPIPKEVTGIPLHETVKSIGAGFYNTLAVCRSGYLYCAGENQNEQCGKGPENLYNMTRVKEVNNVVSAEGGYCHTLIQTAAGKVFSMGCGFEGQRGVGVLDDENSPPATSTEVILPNSESAAQVAAGANHSIILSKTGTAYTFGANDVGQCGVPSDFSKDIDGDGDDENSGIVWSPKAVPIPAWAGPVTKVSAGYAHSVLTTRSGKVFSFGQNDNGQLGIGKGQDDITDLTESRHVPVQIV
ncbi:chromosome condensation regulator RCC1 [Nitzschia inconspicua]|uniref:Chromosome condensation regulator RCC1 n=1 Tax=Nitzschia inconspicua TaxID=303405 RepID=A0A9K3M0Y6_9STRA|nr:chromosome condensation regulator RCC1 [Nitzschia inconspicua]